MKRRPVEEYDRPIYVTLHCTRERVSGRDVVNTIADVLRAQRFED